MGAVGGKRSGALPAGAEDGLPVSAVEVARAELEEGLALAKCQVCGCMREALEAIGGTKSAAPEVRGLAERAAGWIGRLGPQQYTCLGCPHCYPAEALNALNQDGALEVAAACAMATTDTPWPVVAGEYTVAGRGTDCPVAVSTLASSGLAEELARRKPAGLCIVGKTETENIGIDKIVKNVVSNPAIRYLVVAGTDAAGHRSGQTLLALAEHGVDARMHVTGSLGKRPVLRNVTRDEVEAFRQQVRVVDLIGCEDPDRIGATVSALAGEPASEVDEGCSCSGACASPSPVEVANARPQTVRARATERLEMDRAGYFVILPDARRGVIVVEHYAYDNHLLHVLEGDTSRELCGAMVAEGWVTQLSHAAYLGRELARAEMALRRGLPYIQDEAQASQSLATGPRPG